jgi:pyruvate-formate lyase
MSKKWRVNSEWRFDPDLDDCARARLIEALKPVVSRSFSDTRKELRNRLAKHPELNHVASLGGTELTGQSLVGKLSYLCLFSCNRSQAEPVQCVVFVGSETYTSRKCDEYQAHVIEHTKRQGGNALIVERDFVKR